MKISQGSKGFQDSEPRLTLQAGGPCGCVEGKGDVYATFPVILISWNIVGLSSKQYPPPLKNLIQLHYGEFGDLASKTTVAENWHGHQHFIFPLCCLNDSPPSPPPFFPFFTWIPVVWSIMWQVFLSHGLLCLQRCMWVRPLLIIRIMIGGSLLLNHSYWSIIAEVHGWRNWCCQALID